MPGKARITNHSNKFIVQPVCQEEGRRAENKNIAMPRKKHPDDDKPLSIEQARAKIENAVSDLLAGNDPGPIVFRLKRTRKASDTYPLKLTQQQRESLIAYTQLKGKLKNKLKEAGDGAQVFDVTRKELEGLNEELGQATMYARGQHKRRLLAVMGKVAELLAEDHAGLFGEDKPKTRKTAPKKGELLYQFKITLLDTKPAIWRRIQVMDCTLADFHDCIQAAFGWWNNHLHQFEIGGNRYGPLAAEDFDFDEGMLDETEVSLATLIPKSGRKARWIYEYDFGDGWRHEVLFEGFPIADPKAKYPLCVEGERACPPEDCGGPWGYVEYLAAIADPDHEQHQDMLQWSGPFDPEDFDAKKATIEMRKARK